MSWEALLEWLTEGGPASLVAAVAIVPAAWGLVSTSRQQRQVQAEKVLIYRLAIEVAGELQFDSRVIPPHEHEVHLVNRSDQPIYFPVVMVARRRWWSFKVESIMWPFHRVIRDEYGFLVPDPDSAPDGIVMPGQHVRTMSRHPGDDAKAVFRDSAGRRWMVQLATGRLRFLKPGQGGYWTYPRHTIAVEQWRLPPEEQRALVVRQAEMDAAAATQKIKGAVWRSLLRRAKR